VDEVVPALVPLAKRRALVDAALELELPQAVVDCLQVVVCELVAKHLEEAGEAFRAEAVAVLVRKLPEPLQHVRVELQHLHRAMEDPVRPGAVPQPPDLALAHESFDSKPVHLHDDVRVREAVVEHPLPIDDRLGVVEA